MVDTMLHEHGAFERNQDGNLRSRSSLIKCAKDTGRYRQIPTMCEKLCTLSKSRLRKQLINQNGPIIRDQKIRCKLITDVCCGSNRGRQASLLSSVN